MPVSSDPKVLDRRLDEILIDSSVDEESVRFAKRVFGGDRTRYRRRLYQYGLVGHSRVLDAGCGFGQWSVALAGLNEAISSVDISPERIGVLEEVVKAIQLENVTGTTGSIVDLPFQDSEFNAVFCYGAVFLVDWRRAITEFGRVLVPGGQLYVSANAIGWYLDLWERGFDQKFGNLDLRQHVAEVFTNTAEYGRTGRAASGVNLIVEPEELADAVVAAGFREVRAGPEGTLTVGTGGNLVGPFFKGSHNGLVAVHELLAKKYEGSGNDTDR